MEGDSCVGKLSRWSYRDPWPYTLIYYDRVIMSCLSFNKLERRPHDLKTDSKPSAYWMPCNG